MTNDIALKAAREAAAKDMEDDNLNGMADLARNGQIDDGGTVQLALAAINQYIAMSGDGIITVLEDVVSAHKSYKEIWPEGGPPEKDPLWEACEKADALLSQLKGGSGEDYHKPDASGYSRADEEWFFDMDGKP